MVTKTRRTVYIDVKGKLIPLGTAQITYYESRSIYDIVLDKLDIAAKEGDTLFSQ